MNWNFRLDSDPRDHSRYLLRLNLCVVISVCAEANSRPDPAGKNACDVLAVDHSKSGDEAIAGAGQSEVISEEEIAAWRARDNSFQVEGRIREANLVAPASRVVGEIV